MLYTYTHQRSVIKLLIEVNIKAGWRAGQGLKVRFPFFFPGLVESIKKQIVHSLHEKGVDLHRAESRGGGVQGVNKVRALRLRAGGSDVIFPKSLRSCNKDPPPPPLPNPTSTLHQRLHHGFFLSCNGVVRSELPPGSGAHWLRRVLNIQ